MSVWMVRPGRTGLANRAYGIVHIITSGTGFHVFVNAIVLYIRQKRHPNRSLTATLIGKTAELVLLLLFPCLMDG